MKYIFIIFSFILLSGSYASAQSLMTNKQIADSLIKESINNLFQVIQEQDSFQAEEVVYVNINEHPAKSLIQYQLLEQKPEKYNIRFTNDENHKPKINLIIGEVGAKYNYLNNDYDEFMREIIIELSAFTTDKDGISIPIAPIVKKYSDVNPINQVTQLNQNSPEYLQATLAEPELSIYSKYIEPAVIVTVAVLTVVLFFSIRSN
jgi:hypothetical protein